jgi:hypothetical protein
MNRLVIEYLTDGNGNQTAVVIPIELWRNILLQDTDSIETIKENIEDYCLNKAMDKAKITPLLSREQAIDFLAEDDDLKLNIENSF